MRSSLETPIPSRKSLLLLAGLLLAPGAIGFACSTFEPVDFADGGDCVAGGCENNGAVSSSGAGVPCTVDPACAVSFKTDIFAGIFDGPAGCTETSVCHGAQSSPGGVSMEAGKAAAALTSLKAAKIPSNPGPAGPYIVG